MTIKDPIIRYFDDSDILVFYTEDSSADGETVAPDLSVHYNRDGEVVEVVIYHAVRLLGPYLFPVDGQAGKPSGVNRDMNIFYAQETDTLELQTGEPPYVEKTVAPGLCVNFDMDGWAMGVTIERAAELLRPYLLAEGTAIA